MHEPGKTNQELNEENALLKQRIEELEQFESDRKRAEEAFQETESKYQAAFELSSDAIIWVDIQTEIIINCNPAAENMIGIPRDQLIGQNRSILHPPELKGFYSGHFRRHAERGSNEESDAELISATGKRIPVMISATRLQLGNRAVLQGIFRDITDRKLMEKSLRESEEKYRSLFEGINDAVFVHDLDEEGLPGRFLQVNDVACRRLGYTREELLSLTPRDITSQEEYERIADKRIDLASQGDILAEMVHVTKDGQKIPVESNIHQFQYLGRQVALSISRDITERKQIEEALRETKDYLENLIDYANAPIIVWNPQFRIIRFNHAFESLTGRAADDVIGKNLEILFPPDLTDTSMELIKKTLAGEHWESVEISILHNHGTVRTVLWNSATIFAADGTTPVATIAQGYDITERKYLDQKLRESEKRFRQLADSTWEGLLIHRDGIILDANQALFDLFGYDAEEVIGKSVIGLIAPEFAEDAMQKLKEGASWFVLNFEGKGCKKDGAAFPFEALGRPITHNNIPASVLAIRDLTEQKQAEADKEKLEAQNRQLQKNESLGRMAGAIAHTFNNQLGVVIGNLELALMDLSQGAKPVNSLTTAMQAANKAADVSSLMLTYLGQTPGKREPLDLSDVCLRSLPILRAVMPGEVLLEPNLPSPGPNINANANQIQQVLTNLITNAWEAVGEEAGAIHLRVKTVSLAEISIVHRYPIDWQPQDNAYACLEVTDTGCGIEDEDIEKIFDPFFSSKFTGRGMGLATVMGIVRAHGGVVTVESEPGQGSTFRIFFPVSVEEVLRQPDKAAQPLATEGGGTILLVDDEEMVRDMAAAMITRLGFSVLEAKDGIEAVEVFRKRQDEIRCVLTDLTMPRMNGWETLTALRKLAPDIPVILASGYDKAHVMSGDHPELPQVFLGKPYKLKELSDAISRALVNRK